MSAFFALNSFQCSLGLNKKKSLNHRPGELGLGVGLRSWSKSLPKPDRLINNNPSSSLFIMPGPLIPAELPECPELARKAGALIFEGSCAITLARFQMTLLFRHGAFGGPGRLLPHRRQDSTFLISGFVWLMHRGPRKGYWYCVIVLNVFNLSVKHS